MGLNVNRCARPERCVNSKGKKVLCNCPLANVMCARQSKNRDAFFSAIRQGRHDVVTFLLSAQHCEEERILDFRDWLNVRDPMGRCGIQVAVKYKKERILKTLIDHIKHQLDFGHLLNLSDEVGFNAMLQACQIGSLRMVMMLNAAGAKWTAVNHEHMNGRDIAVAEGHTVVIGYIDQGQDMGHEEENSAEVLEDSEHIDGEAEHAHEDPDGRAEEQVDEKVLDPNEGILVEPEAVLVELDEQELQDRCDILLMHPVFDSFELSHAQVAAKGCELRKYKRNDVIFGHDATAEIRSCLSFVLSGEVRVQRASNDRHDDLLEEGDSYGESALLLGETFASVHQTFASVLYDELLVENCAGRHNLSVLLTFDHTIPGEESSDIVSANLDCYLMHLPKKVLQTIFLEDPTFAESVGASLAAKKFTDAEHGKFEITHEMKEVGEYQYGKELEKKIFSFFEIPIPEVIEEEVDRKARRVNDVPLLEDTIDALPIKMRHTHGFGSDKKVNERLKNVATGIDEEYLFQYVDACNELGLSPLSCVIFQLRCGAKVLDLRGLRITWKEALALSAAFAYMTRPLEGFDISNNPIFDKGCVNDESVRFCGIVSAIALNTHIKSVILSRTRISLSTAVQLGKIIAYHGSLTKLDLSCNDLRDKGIDAVCNGLCHTASIMDLNLSNTKCSFRGATALGDMFRSNQTLLVANLSWNSFLSKGSTSVLQGMKVHPKLEEVHFEWNLLGHAGGVALGQLLQSTQTIKRIDVSHCQIPESATDAMCAGLITNNTLQHMRLQFNPLKLGVPRIKDAMLSNKNWTEALPMVRLDHCNFDACNYHSAVVNTNIPTGHYKFDLSKTKHRENLGKLIDLAAVENGENWRNETFDGVRFNYPKDHAWAMPAKGILEFDFVHMEKSEDQIMPEKNFTLLTSMLNRAVSSEVRIDLIKQACSVYRILGEDAMALMYSLHRTAEREEALMALFSRVCGRYFQQAGVVCSIHLLIPSCK